MRVSNQVLSLLIFFCLIFLDVSGQQLPESFHRAKENPNKYENQGMLHSAYLILTPDSSFVYYNIYEVGYYLTFGNYSTNGDKMIITWDSVKTSQAIKDTTIYKKYFQYGFPMPFKIVRKQYKIHKNSLDYDSSTH